MKKIILIIIFISFIMVYIYGLSQKNSYTNVWNSNKNKEQVIVGIIHEDDSDIFEDFESKLDSCPIVLRIKALSSFEFYGREGRQKVEVITVLKGEESLKSGDNIFLTSIQRTMIKSGDFFMLSTGYTNLMQKDEEYIVFVSGKADTKGFEENVYRIYGDDTMFVCPIFQMTDNYNIIEKNKYVYGNDFVLYKDAEECELLTDSETLLNEFIEIKHNIIEKYKEKK